MKPDLYILLSIYDRQKIPQGAEYMMISDLAEKACSKEIFSLLCKYRSITLLTQDISTIPVPFAVAGACRLLTWGSCRWKDELTSKRINIITMIPLFLAFLRDWLLKGHAVKRIKNDLNRLNKIQAPGRQAGTVTKVTYIRSDLPCGLNAGGSVGHIAGVLNNIQAVTSAAPEFLTTDSIPLVSADIMTRLIRGRYKYSNIKNFNTIALNFSSYREGSLALLSP